MLSYVLVRITVVLTKIRARQNCSWNFSSKFLAIWKFCRILENDFTFKAVLVLFYTLDQRFSTAGTRPGTGTWRPFYRDLKYY